jgi:hypothetical protein
MTHCPQCRGDIAQMATVCPHCGYGFADTRPIEWPFWVKLATGMRTAPARSTAVIRLVIYLLLDVVCIAEAYFLDWRVWFLAVLLCVVALGTGLAIRWIDKHGKWAKAA